MRVQAAITDERTLAGWLSSPTEIRAASAQASGTEVLVRHCDVEEHVLDPATGRTKRCDVTLRDRRRALLAAELKRPEVAAVDAADLVEDARRKAVARGFEFYITCNFTEAALWSTDDGPAPAAPVARRALAPALTNSSDARTHRRAIQDAWTTFLDDVEHRLLARSRADAASARLPPQVEDLRRALRDVAEEATPRLSAAITADQDFRDRVAAQFSDQFGLDVLADGSAGAFAGDVEQVATISTFVVATRLLLYSALTSGPVDLDPLAVTASSTDPQRIRDDLSSVYRHARERTGDYRLQLTPTFLDEIAFAGVGEPSEVAVRWARLVDVINNSDWTGPAEYVPALYESLLDDRHRHATGVHYTPDAVVELMVAYAVVESADTVLEPASGAGTFAVLAYDRKKALGSSHEESLSEIYPVELAEFAAGLTSLGLSLADRTATSAYPRVVHDDFFDLRPGGPTDLDLPGEGADRLPAAFDAVIGNPPYVRFENLPADYKDKLARVLSHDRAHHGLLYPDFTGKADLFAFFVAHAAAFLREGGRMAFIVSWAVLATNYGGEVMAFLARHFHIDAVVDSRVERFFAAKTNTVVLLARKAPLPDPRARSPHNPHIDPDQPVRLVRLKRPLLSLLADARRGKRGEDLVDAILDCGADDDSDPRWDVKVFRHGDLWDRDDTDADLAEESP